MKSSAALALASIASATVMNNNDYLFMRYIVEYNKEYGTVEEFNMRKANFVKAHEEILEINNQNTSLTVGHNNFSDWTQQEYEKLQGLRNQPVPDIQGEEMHEFTYGELPVTVNWVSQGKVAPVQDQGYCASCYAFSAAAALESAHAISTGKVVKISEQQFVDCTSSYGNLGCHGGYYHKAWKYAERHAVILNASYPYQSGKTGLTGQCTDSGPDQQYKVRTYKNVVSNTNHIKSAIAKQPVSVALCASSSAFKAYRSGVISEAQCQCTDMTHAVVAVGYGVEAGEPYYLVRNSWGTSYGDGGYLKIAQADGKGACGINQNVKYPVV